jgi:hypothetical protein
VREEHCTSILVESLNKVITNRSGSPPWQPRQIVARYTRPATNSKNEARLTPGQGRFVSHVGWFTEVGKDETFEGFLKAAGVAQLEMRRPRAGGQAMIACDWHLGEELCFFPLTAGPGAPTVAASLSPRARGDGRRRYRRALVARRRRAVEACDPRLPAAGRPDQRQPGADQRALADDRRVAGGTHRPHARMRGRGLSGRSEQAPEGGAARRARARARRWR